MKNLNIGTRLAAGFALLLALMMLMTVIGIRNLQTVADGTQAMQCGTHETAATQQLAAHARRPGPLDSHQV